jgi:pimeloyl-ACP methyl ester carboxylesterase
MGTMPTAQVNGIEIAYEIVGAGSGIPWVITPGGRFSKDTPGVIELAHALADAGSPAVVWDRPNTGASEVCFSGSSESAMQADALAALLRHLDLPPAIIAGGSGGARVSLLTAARHPDVARALAVWWISGGPFGLLTLAVHYCGDSVAAAWRSGMAAVADLPSWAEVIERNPINRGRFLAQERTDFIQSLERWMLAYCPRDDELIPGLRDDDVKLLAVKALVFRSGESDPHHTRATSEDLAGLLPNARLVEPPWGDQEWNERVADAQAGGPGIFSSWPQLAPQLIEWSKTI